MVTRIRKLLEQKQLTPTQFADLIGVGRPVMSHILSERNKPSLEVVQRIISAFPELSLPWLLSGVGEMLAEAPTSTKPDLPVDLGPATIAPALPPAAPIAVEPANAGSATVAAPATPAATPTELFKEPELKAAAEIPAPGAMPAPPSQLSSAPRFSAVPLAPVPASAPLSAPTATPTRETVDASAAPASVVSPPQMKPFRAARFTPKAAVAPTGPVPVPASPVLPEPVTPAPPAVPSLASAQALVPAGSAPADVMLPFLAEPGKAIRRIVIFYRDGSFADYQPEQ